MSAGEGAEATDRVPHAGWTTIRVVVEHGVLVDRPYAIFVWTGGLAAELRRKGLKSTRRRRELARHRVRKRMLEPTIVTRWEPWP